MPTGSPPSCADETTVTDHLRDVFGRRCCYCTISEEETSSGPAFFEIEHFKPVCEFKRPGRAKSEQLCAASYYENLGYACSTCNRAKSGEWPKRVTRERRFLDASIDPLYPDHLAICWDAIEPRNHPGPYMHARLKFGTRPNIAIRLASRRAKIRDLQAAWQGKHWSAAVVYRRRAHAQLGYVPPVEQG